METEKIIFFRNLIFKTFSIGVLFAILFFVVTIVFWNTWLPAWIMNFFEISENELGNLVLHFFMNVRIVLVFFMLAPALALHWMAKNKK